MMGPSPATKTVIRGSGRYPSCQSFSLSHLTHVTNKSNAWEIFLFDCGEMGLCKDPENCELNP